MRLVPFFVPVFALGMAGCVPMYKHGDYDRRYGQPPTEETLASGARRVAAEAEQFTVPDGFDAHRCDMSFSRSFDSKETERGEEWEAQKHSSVGCSDDDRIRFYESNYPTDGAYQ